MHHSRALVPVHRAQLTQAHRQIAIGAQRVFVNQDVSRAIHRLHAVLGVVEFHEVEKVLRVVALVARGEEQLAPHHVRGIDERVAALHVLLAHPVFHLLADDAALGMPENQPGASQVLDGKQVELLAEHAVVALLGFFNAVEISIEVFLREERSPINALQLRILLVAKPVGAGDVEQLERLDFSGRGYVRAPAEIEEFSRLVDRDLFIGLGELLDEVALHEIAFSLELLQAFLTWEELTRVGNVLLGQLLHLFFNLLEIFGSEGRRTIEVVKESVLGRRAVPELGFGEEFQYGRSQQVRGRVPVDLQRLRIALGKDAEVGILVERPGQVNEVAVGLGDDRCVGETRADGFRHVQWSGAFRNVFRASVRKVDMNVIRHGVQPVVC